MKDLKTHTILVIILLVLACSSVRSETNADQSGYFRNWLLCGAFQTSGFSMVAPYFETMIRPNAWETYTSEWAPDRGWDVTWKPYHSPGNDVDFDLKETFADRPAMDWPPGSPPTAYAHLYLTSGQSDVLLDFHATGPARVWLNGREVSDMSVMTSGISASAGFHPGKDDSPYRHPVTLVSGVNRIMVKLYLPQKDYGTGLARPTKFNLRILGVDGKPITDLPTSLSNPALYEPDLKLRSSDRSVEPGTCLSDQTAVDITSKRFRNVFYTGAPISLSAGIRILNIEEQTKRFGNANATYSGKPIAARLTVNLYDYYGKVVARAADDITYGDKASVIKWNFGKLPKGHYTLYSWIHVGGRLLKSISPAMISVVDAPHPLHKGAVSKFGHSYYYVGVAEPEFIEILAAAGVRLSVGSMHWWWLTEDPIEWIKKPYEKRTWQYYPKDEVLKEARKWGVELTGDLGGCWPAGFKKSYYKDYMIPEDTKDKLVIINPYWPTYPNDSPEFANLVNEYVGATVKKFGSNFRYWKLQNELNTWVNAGATPEWWGPVLKAIYLSAKKADPNCRIVNTSMSGTGLSFLEPLFQQGYDKYFDVLDYHIYSWPFYDPVNDLGGLNELLKLMDKYGVNKPLWNGEFGAYRSLLEDGARTQAGAYVRYLVIAHTYDCLKLVAAHFHDALGWNSAGENGQYPSYVAYRICADNMEGATNHQKLNLGNQVAAYRFKQNGGRVTVVWMRNGKSQTVSIPVRKDNVRIIHILGKEQAVKAINGKISLQCTGEPIYIRD